ncbi:MAG TPA: PEP-CTERM sorting domain-containing protein [Bryobacteraceae bacterium]|nr:PEP-CTERM sorting domain-containing protein [Bryobacteraceae bacterium]
MGLPVFMNGTDDLTFLKFKIDLSTIATINSFEIDVSVFDDGDAGGESADIEFAQPSTNISLGSFTNLNGTTEGSPETFSFFLTSDEINQVIPTITDGTFRIRIQRGSGDFYLAGGSATLDVTSTPEPSAWFMAAGGLLLGTLAIRRRNLKRT